MALTDDTLIVIALGMMNFFMLWRGSWTQRIIADILFVILGISTYLIFTLNEPWGILIAVIGIIDGLFTTFKA